MIKTWLTLVVVIATAMPAAVMAASKSATPEARVQAFAADYFRLHAQAGHWNAALARLDKAHFMAGGGRGLSHLMPSEPEYRPGDEILHITSGETTRVETRASTGALAKYHEFELREVGRDWRIVRIRHYFKAVDEPFMTPDQRPRFETPGIDAWGPAIDSDGWETFDFRDGQKIYTYNAAGAVQVRRVGTLNVTSGNLVVGNLGYSAYYLSPIGQRIAPGQYPVEIAIADASSVLTANGRHVELIVEALNDSTAIATGQMATLVNANDAVIWTEWFGDAGHRVFWGADASGKPAVLLVNFSLDDTMDIE